jgi:sRNA-binding regulator protein Hfq
VGTQPALKVFEEEIGELKKQVDGIRKKLKAVLPGPSSADILNRYLGKKATFVLRGGKELTGTLVEHDRYNCLVESAEGPVVLLKHALDWIKPGE